MPNGRHWANALPTRRCATSTTAGARCVAQVGRRCAPSRRQALVAVAPAPRANHSSLNSSLRKQCAGCSGFGAQTCFKNQQPAYVRPQRPPAPPKLNLQVNFGPSPPIFKTRSPAGPSKACLSSYLNHSKSMTSISGSLSPSCQQSFPQQVVLRY